MLFAPSSKLRSGASMPKIDYTALWFWLNVGHLVITAAIGVYVWWANREKVTAGKFARLEKQVGERITRGELEEFKTEQKERLGRHRKEMVDMANRLIRIESDICHLPGQQAIENLGNRITALHGSLSEFSGKLQGVHRAVDLINQFLIEKGLSGQ